MSLLSRILFAVHCAIGAIACNTEQTAVHPASCEDVGAHFVEVAQADLDSLRAVDAQRASALRPTLSGLRRDVIAKCRSQKWSARARECYAAAESSADARHLCAHLFPDDALPRQP